MVLHPLRNLFVYAKNKCRGKLHEGKKKSKPLHKYLIDTSAKKVLLFGGPLMGNLMQRKSCSSKVWT